ncbi:hypothetical protein BCF46_3771 [Litoreibacter meonggei]|uniref:Uncharacterized protein n=1 Tax=Litoreibacter meonggei TaxID=1049199 RepID=A0A497VHY5_9RHOB|nr:hypothetical protein [Litoreibacter meonggei]RLJ36303.1 hypothetical protein BCF46_3771 [Litoreibacter meonggei]
MSFKKLLSTGACMVIIGISAGTSYGLFQRLTEQVATPALAQTLPTKPLAVSETAEQSRFVAAGVTMWTPQEKSNVPTPMIVLPTGTDQPEPPLLRYAPIATNDATSVTPTLLLFAHIEDAVILDARPRAIALPKPTAEARPVARDVVVASAPHNITTPGTLRRFRGQNTGKNSTSSSDQDGIFERIFTPQTALQPLQLRRPTTAASARTAQRLDRFRSVWSTGVYR